MRRHFQGFGLAACVIGLALLAASCSSDHATRAGVGRVQVFMTDAPAAVDAVNLVVRAVAVHNSAISDTVEGWETLRSDSTTVDLLALQGGILSSLAIANVPAGHYDQVRLLLGPGSTVVIDGVTHPLVIPSGLQSGLKLVGQFDVPDGGAVDITLDWNAASSVFQTGTGTWMLKPVVRFVVMSTAGTIIGTLSPPNGAVAIRAIQGDTLQTTTASASTGHFTLAALPAGSYTVSFEAAAGFRDTTLTGVAVTAGGTTDLGTVVMTPQ